MTSAHAGGAIAVKLSWCLTDWADEKRHAELPVIRKKEDRELTGRQPWELRSCELVFASVEVLHSVAAGPPT